MLIFCHNRENVYPLVNCLTLQRQISSKLPKILMLSLARILPVVIIGVQYWKFFFYYHAKKTKWQEYATTSVKTMCMFQKLNSDLFIVQIWKISMRGKENWSRLSNSILPSKDIWFASILFNFKYEYNLWENLISLIPVSKSKLQTG